MLCGFKAVPHCAEGEWDLQDTSTTVAGVVWVSAKRRKLWRSLSSAAFLAVALMCATVT